MKYLFLALAIAGTAPATLVWSDQGSNAFIEGFSRSLQAQIEARRQAEQYVQQQEEARRAYDYRQPSVVFSPITDNGRVTTMVFSTLSACENFISGSIYPACVTVEK